MRNVHEVNNETRSIMSNRKRSMGGFATIDAGSLPLQSPLHHLLR
jgi:hypothetical protein